MKSPRSEICSCGTPIPRAHIQGLLMALDEIAAHTGSLPDVVLADCRHCEHLARKTDEHPARRTDEHLAQYLRQSLSPNLIGQ